MTAQHTPGPWHCIVTSNPDCYEVWGEGEAETHAPLVTMTANARLIAAAPELLAALELISQCARSGPVLMSEAVGNICRDAINKATGR